MTIAKSICERWDFAGLDSFKDIYEGCPEGPDHMLKAGGADLKSDGGPKNETLPRARYNVMDHELVATTGASKIYKSGFFIFLYSKSIAELNSTAEDVIEAFENSHKFTTSPFELDEGCVVNLEFAGRQDHTRYGEVLFTELLFEISYTRPRINPVPPA